MSGKQTKRSGTMFRSIQMYISNTLDADPRIRVQFVAYCNNVRRVHHECTVRSTEMLADWMITWNDDGIVPTAAVSYH